MIRTGIALHRRLTAYHEAAHAVMAFRFRIPIMEIVVSSWSPEVGYMSSLARPLVESIIQENRFPAGQPWEVIRRDTEQHLMVLLAGGLAEAKMCGSYIRMQGALWDLERVATLCEYLEVYRWCLTQNGHRRIPDHETEDLGNRLRRRTRRILGQPRVWRAISAVAEDLEGWSRLTGHDAADTVEWSRRIRNQLRLRWPLPEGARPGVPVSAGQSAGRGFRRRGLGWLPRPRQGFQVARIGMAF